MCVSRCAIFISNCMNGSVGHTGVSGTPGSWRGCADECHVIGVDSRVVLLPSKTRPKRIDFIGSDGSRRRFLLKGGEDLQQEQRMQQLLACINACLRTHFADASANLSEGSNSAAAGSRRENAQKESKNPKSRGLTTSILTTFRDELQVHVLNVTPLGRTMGLVQWLSLIHI